MIAIMFLATLSLAPSPYRPLPGDPVAERMAAKERAAKDKSAQSCAAGEGLARLPYARGRSFCTLDAYLAHLEQQGAIDLPWWRPVRPGVYERVTSRRGAPREIATRAELMKRFGFKS